MLVIQCLSALLLFAQAAAFSLPSKSSNCCSTALWAKSRKARRQTDRSRPQSFYDAIEDANDRPAGMNSKKKKKKKKVNDDSGASEQGEGTDRQESQRQKILQNTQAQMDERPDVSTMEVDDETGIEIVRQGKSIMDVVTRKAVKLSDMGPEYRLAQMFPGIPPDIRDKYRVDIKTVTVPQLVQSLKESCSVSLKDGSRGIPPHPSVSNNGLDFVLANRDYLGPKMKHVLGSLTMKTMSEGKKDEAREMKNLWRNYFTIENHIAAPFRQMLMDAEGRVGPNFGNLDITSYLNGDLYERTANYLVLKGMVANWEKKVVDADYLERNPQTRDKFVSIMAQGDPRRFLPEAPIMHTLKECTQVCAMSQQMTKAYVETPELFDDLPVEVRFFEAALSNKGGDALRKFMNEDFCPKEGVTPLGLIEGMRRLAAQLDTMQIDPYADILNLMRSLILAMSVGTDAETDPYVPYLTDASPSGPAYFPTYTFNHDKQSRVRFLDSQFEGAQTQAPSSPPPPSSENGLGRLGEMFNFGGASKPPKNEGSEEVEEYYRVPSIRAAGRPHELGWLDMFEDEKSERFGQVAPGSIIVE